MRAAEADARWVNPYGSLAWFEEVWDKLMMEAIEEWPDRSTPTE